MANILQMECEKCAVQNTCSHYGSSPLEVNGEKFFCHIVGGYGRVPVDKDILSKKSLEIMEKNGPCLTIAEVPTLDESGIMLRNVIKVFAPPVLHERDLDPIITSSDLIQRSHS